MQSKSILAQCRCGQKYNLPEKFAGGRLPCKHCESFFVVPFTRPANEVKVRLFCGHTVKIRECDLKPQIKCPACNIEMKINLKNNIQLCDRLIYRKVIFHGEEHKDERIVRNYTAQRVFAREKSTRRNPWGLLVIEKDALYFFQTKPKSLKVPESLFYVRSGFSPKKGMDMHLNDLFMQLFHIADINTILDEFTEFYGRCMIFPRAEYMIEIERFDTGILKTSQKEYNHYKNSAFPYPENTGFVSSSIMFQDKEKHGFHFEFGLPPEELFDAIEQLGYKHLAFFRTCDATVNVLTLGKGLLKAAFLPKHELKCFTVHFESITERVK